MIAIKITMVACMLYPYIIYPFFLLCGKFFLKNHMYDSTKSAFPMTMVIAVHNEIELVEKLRSSIVNFLNSNELNQVIIVDDYSSDELLQSLNALNIERLLLLKNIGDRGRAGAHNFAIKYISNDIIFFADASTYIPIESFERISSLFIYEKVGCVNAQLTFMKDGDDNDWKHAGDLYWRFEMLLRKLETSLGIYAFSSGPCMAVRKKLFKTLPITGDVDFSTPIDVVNQGFYCVHDSLSVAYDYAAPTKENEFKSRIRMVSKNFLGTLIKINSLNLTTFAIISHKIFRWAFPFFYLALELSLLIDGSFFILLALIFVQLYALLDYKFNLVKSGILYKLTAFVVVNYCFLVGIVKAFLGKAPSFYSPTRKL